MKADPLYILAVIARMREQGGALIPASYAILRVLRWSDVADQLEGGFVGGDVYAAMGAAIAWSGLMDSLPLNAKRPRATTPEGVTQPTLVEGNDNQGPI